MKRRRNILNWAGFSVTLVAFVSYIPFFALFPATRDPEHNRGKISGSILAALSAVLFALFVASVTYYSTQIPSAETALGVSRKAPQFVLANTAGTKISSSDLLKDHRGLVLVFYRGYW